MLARDLFRRMLPPSPDESALEDGGTTEDSGDDVPMEDSPEERDSVQMN